MPITVKVSSIDAETFEKILNHYNLNKPADEYPLERLNRAEGGFQIKLGPRNNLIDANHQIRQLRWNRRRLESTHIGFTKEQEQLLCNALVEVLGESNVSM
jgi:hypothetical protein